MTADAEPRRDIAPAEEVFGALRDHVSPGVALGARFLGRSAYEVRADGAVVHLSDGRELIDLGSYAVTLLGHRHPAVVAAVTEQLGLMPTSTRVLANEQTAALARDLAATVGGPYERVWLGTNGADAVEAALKLARRGTGRSRVLAAAGGFHGKSLGALAATANPIFHEGLAGAVGPATHLDPTDTGAVAREVAAGDVAALIFEPIQGEGGVRPLDTAVLRQWSADARAAGVAVISDEIQCGLGRCGPFSLALDAGLEPDAILFGKPLGGGVLPLSAMVATTPFFAPLIADPTFHSLTFGGQPLACAAGRAALVALAELAARGPEIETAFAAQLAALASAYPRVIKAVRGRGLLWGLEMQTAGLAGEALLFLAEHGIVASPCLSAPSVLRLCPSLVLTDAQLTAAFAAIGRAIADCQEQVVEAEPEE
ncbi:MAG: aminotransferase class III-fold pyridoxal phosphate-dependent enzyme, partial [Solirubrobacteraceae bacterium]